MAYFRCTGLSSGDDKVKKGMFSVGTSASASQELGFTPSQIICFSNYGSTSYVQSSIWLGSNATAQTVRSSGNTGGISTGGISVTGTKFTFTPATTAFGNVSVRYIAIG